MPRNIIFFTIRSVFPQEYFITILIQQAEYCSSRCNNTFFFKRDEKKIDIKTTLLEQSEADIL